MGIHYLIDSTGKRYNFGGKGLVKEYVTTYLDLLSDGNTIAWYSYDASVTLTGDASVSLWADCLGSGNNMVQFAENGHLMPSYSSSEGIMFDGVNDVLWNTSMVSAQPIMIYVVINQITYTDAHVIFSLGDDPATIAIRQYNPRRNQMLAGGAVFATDDNIMASDNSWAIVRYCINGANSFIRSNNDAAVTGTVNAQSTAYFNAGSSSVCPNMSIKEIIIRKVTDTSDNQSLIYNYLRVKYNL